MKTFKFTICLPSLIFLAGCSTGSIGSAFDRVAGALQAGSAYCAAATCSANVKTDIADLGSLFSVAGTQLIAGTAPVKVLQNFLDGVLSDVTQLNGQLPGLDRKTSGIVSGILAGVDEFVPFVLSATATANPAPATGAMSPAAARPNSVHWTISPSDAAKIQAGLAKLK